MSDHPFIPKSNSKIVPPFIPKPKESLEAENARLIAENERLRKAGDAVIVALDKRDDYFDNSDKRQAIADWNAAKEGKQP